MASRAAFAVAAAALLAGCGREGTEAPAAGASSSTAMASSSTPSLAEMVFRPEEPGARLLGTVFRHAAAGYSVRPPLGWSRTAPPPDTGAIRFRTVFRDPATGDFLDLGVVAGGPPVISPAAMEGHRDALARRIRESGQARLLGTDAFRFNGLSAVQLLMNRNRTVILQLLVFREPGRFLEVVWAVHQGRYRDRARIIEASLASLVWR